MKHHDLSARYHRFTQRLAQSVSREDLAEAARTLALKLAVYEHYFGELDGSVGGNEPPDNQVQIASRGVELLLGALDAASERAAAERAVQAPDRSERAANK